MSAVLHLPSINSAPYVQREKLGDPSAPAFTAVNGRPLQFSPHASTAPCGLTVRRPNSQVLGAQAASHSIFPIMAIGEGSPDSLSKENRSPSLDDQRLCGSSREWPIADEFLPAAEQRPSLEPCHCTTPATDRLRRERRWNADPSKYQDNHYHDPRPVKLTQHMLPSHVSETNECEEDSLDRSRLDEHSDQKRVRRKRQFFHRTKTGCGTCRKRKKKCDEAKPNCNSCLRGKFKCSGYAKEIPWSKEGASKEPLALQATECVSSSGTRARYAGGGDAHRLHILHDQPTQKLYSKSGSSDHVRLELLSVHEQHHTPPMPDSWTRTSIAPSRHRSEQPPLPPPFASTYGRMSVQSPHAHPPPLPLPPPQTMAPMTAEPLTSLLLHIEHPSSPPMSEKDKMLAGKPFLPYTDQLVNERALCSEALYRFNSLNSAAVYIAANEREQHFKDVIAAIGVCSRPSGGRVTGYLGSNIDVAIPFYCDYGYNISIEDNVVIGPHSQLLNSGRIAIGRDTKIGARVTILTLTTPSNTRALKGSKGTKIARDVCIGENVYIGDGCIIEAGVRIGNNAIVRTGSVVVRDVPADCSALGNPA